VVPRNSWRLENIFLREGGRSCHSPAVTNTKELLPSAPKRVADKAIFPSVTSKHSVLLSPQRRYFGLSCLHQPSLRLGKSASRLCSIDLNTVSFLYSKVNPVYGANASSTDLFGEGRRESFWRGLQATVLPLGPAFDC